MKKKFFLINLMLFYTLTWVFAQAPEIKYEVIKKTELKRNPYNDAQF